MSYYDDASLILLASGGAQKNGKVYCVKPTDGAGDFTFSRGSNLSATRVNPSQLIEKGRENVLLQSNSFDTTWTNSNTTETSGQIGYDGTNDAWLLNKSASFGNLKNISFSLNSVQSFSLYAKADTLNWLTLELVGGGLAYFDLQNGVVGNTNGLIDSTIVAAGNGYYRCSITVNGNRTGVRIYPADANGDISGTSGSILIQDAQVEQGLVATDVIETTTTTAQAGILERTPRFNYLGVTCPYLLMEPSRTNLVTQSEYIGDSSWLKLSAGVASAPIVTSNYAISPQGTLNASRVVFDINGGTTSSDFSQLYDSVTVPTGDISNSIYIKSNTASNYTMSLVSTVGTPTAILVTTEWQRFDITATTTSTAGSFRLRLRGSESTSDTADVSLWGAQVEAGSYQTSYIPTYGVSQTRASDFMPTNDVSGFMSGNSYTFLIDVDLNTNDNNKVFSTIRNSANSTSFTLRNFQGALRVYNNMDTTYPLGSIFSDTNKWVIRIDGTSYTIFSNNGGTPTKTTGTSLVTQRNFGSLRFDSPTEYKLKQFLLFNTALSDSDCETLTT